MDLGKCDSGAQTDRNWLGARQQVRTYCTYYRCHIIDFSKSPEVTYLLTNKRIETLINNFFVS